MTIGIMQPYFFPYLGYWQLLNAVDTYVVLDDVTFIKQGYINKNFILCQGKSQQVNIFVNGVSSNKLICDHEINGQPKWKKKILSTISQNYSKAPYYKAAYSTIEKCILYDTNSLSNYLLFQLVEVSNYLNIDTKIISSSSLNVSKELKGQDRVIAFCKQQSASSYINAIGGQNLYNKLQFKENGIELSFLEMENVKYTQLKNEFVPFLSIIDVMMFNSVEDIAVMLNKYRLV